MVTKKIIKVLFREKPFKVFLLLEQTKSYYITEICKKIDLTYSHCHKIIRKLEKSGSVIIIKEGRIRKDTLTTKGVLLQQHLFKVNSILNNGK